MTNDCIVIPYTCMCLRLALISFLMLFQHYVLVSMPNFAVALAVLSLGKDFSVKIKLHEYNQYTRYTCT